MIDPRSYVLAVLLAVVASSATAQEDKIYPATQVIASVSECVDITDRYARKQCIQEQVQRSVMSNFKYPSSLLKQEIERPVRMRFAVMQNGEVENVEILEEPVEGAGKAVLKAFRKSDLQWSPGLIRGEKVNSWVRVSIDLTIPKEPVEEPEPSVPDYFTTVDHMPRIEGCREVEESEVDRCNKLVMTNFFAVERILPEQAKTDSTEGFVQTEFFVDRDGAIVDIAVIDSLGSGCDEEAVRLIRALPSWTPGMHEGDTVKVRIRIPVEFRERKNAGEENR